MVAFKILINLSHSLTGDYKSYFVVRLIMLMFFIKGNDGFGKGTGFIITILTCVWCRSATAMFV